MKALHVIQSLAGTTGGPAYTVPALCNYLADEIEVKIISVRVPLLDDSCEETSSLDETKVFIKRLSCIGSIKQRLVWSPAFPLAVKNEMLQNKPDIIHSHGIWSLENHFSLQEGMKAGVPTVVSPRGMMTSWAMRQKRTKKKFAWKLYQKKDLERATIFHATSEDEAEEIRRLGFTQPIAVLPNGVEIPEEFDSEDLKDKEERILLFLSRIHPKKGLERLIDAWSMIDTTGWKCRIAGPDEDGYLEKIKRKIFGLNLGAEIILFDMVRGIDKQRMYQDADVFILPTNSENFGVVIAEALAAGVPVITTKGAPWRELEDYDCGWWVDINTEAIAEALQNAMSLSDKTRREMGERGRRLVAAHYTWSEIAKEMSSVYKWVCGTGPRPACVQD